MNRTEILNEIVAERLRQDKKWGEQNHPIIRMNYVPPSYVDSYRCMADISRKSCEDAFKHDCGDWGLILEGEVAEALAEGAAGNMEKCKAELIQVAAVAVAMIECIERGKLSVAKEEK